MSKPINKLELFLSPRKTKITETDKRATSYKQVHFINPICSLLFRIFFSNSSNNQTSKYQNNYKIWSNKANSFCFNFYCSTVDLQCCVSFRYTAEWFSFTYPYLYSKSKFLKPIKYPTYHQQHHQKTHGFDPHLLQRTSNSVDPGQVALRRGFTLVCLC